MLTESQMKLVNFVFDQAKKMLFAVGEVPQSYVITHGNKAIAFPLPDHLPVGTGIGMELAEHFAQIEGTELVIFVSEIWRVKADAPEDFDPKIINEDNWQEIASTQFLDGKRPSEMPDKSEALMLLVLEVQTKELHMMMGDIKRDSEGGAYVEDGEWESVPLSHLRTTAFPQKLHS